MKAYFFTLILSLFLWSTVNGQNEIYELKVYELEFFGPKKVLHDYFKKALIPALNRQGVNNIGAFEEIGDALPKKIYLLLSYKNMQSYQEVSDGLDMDDQFASAAKAYWNTAPDKTAFNRMESTFIKSVSGFPTLVKPSSDSTLFELRIYESHNEDALRRKVKMFNESEFDIFSDIGLNTVFFGTNISGRQMPCLTYMLAFKDKEAHNNTWSKFGSHPEWQRIKNLEEYSNSINNISRVFLKPLAYSQL